MRIYISNYRLLSGTLLTLIIILFGLLRKKVFFVNAKMLRLLVKITLIYMTLSVVLFILSLPISIPLKIIVSGILLYGFVKASKNISGNNIIEPVDGYYLEPGLMLLSLGILTLSYANIFYGLGFVFDWSKHRSILLSLYYNPFSPTLSGFDLPIESSLRNARLVYYYAMYLPSVYLIKIFTLFVKINTIEVLTWVLSLAFLSWNLLGLALAFLLIPFSCKKIFVVDGRKVTWGYFYLALITFASLKYWYGVLVFKQFYLGLYVGWFWIMPYFAIYQSFICMWQCIPNQLIVGLLGTVLILIYTQKIKQFPLCLWGAFLLSGSPWCWIGSFPTALYFLFNQFFSNEKIKFGKKLIEFFREEKIELITLTFITLIVLIFYSSKQHPVNFALNGSLLSKNGFLKYLFFLLIELVPVGIILYICIFEKITIPSIVKIQLSILVLLPLFQAGYFNDLVWKSGIPALCIVVFYCAFVIQKTIFSNSVVVKTFLFLYFIAVMPFFLNQYLMGFRVNSRPLENIPHIIEQYQGQQQ